MLNGPKLKSNSSARNYPKFLNTNIQSSSKEKLYSNVPKTMHFNTNNKDRQVKTPSMKIGSKTDSQGNRQISVNLFEKQEKQYQVNTSINNKPIYKVNSLDDVFNNNNNINNQTCESNSQNLNQANNGKLETEEDSNNLKFKVKSDVGNNNSNNIQKQNSVRVDHATERKFSFKDLTARNHSGTQRGKNSNSFREFNNFKQKENQQILENSSNKNYLFLLKEKEKEIENLKRELVNMKNIYPIKPTLSNDIKLNEHFLNVNTKSYSTSNKNNSKSIFKFDAKSNANEKVELFSDRSPQLKNMNNFNSFNNNFQNNINLTNRNSFNSKNFMEILHNYNNLNNAMNNNTNNNLASNNINNNKNNSNNNTNNLSNSANFASSKHKVKSHSAAHTSQNQKNFSSTFSNFFRKSNKKNTEHSSNQMRDGNGKSKSSHKNLSKANTQTTSNPHINSNTNNTNSNTNHNTNSLNNNSNNMQILSNNYNNKNYSSNNNSNSLSYNYNNHIINNNRLNDSNYNLEHTSKKNNTRKTNKNFNSNESNEFASNFSEIVNFEDTNQIIKKPQSNENFISNPYKSSNNNTNKNTIELRKKSSAGLEIGDLDVNENNFRNLNNFSHKHSSLQMPNSTIISGKNLSNVTSYSQNEKEKNLNDKSKNVINDDLIKDKNKLQLKEAENDNNQIFERLNLLKQRTKYVLAKYAENFVKKK